jgi:hypothetical protein
MLGYGAGGQQHYLRKKNRIVEKLNNGRRLNSSGEKQRKRFKDNHFYIAIWNVLSLYRAD